MNEPYCSRCRADCTGAQPCDCCARYGPGRPHDMAGDILESYERRVPGVRAACRNDAVARYTHDLLVHLLDIAGAVMADEGVDAPTRRRVLSTIAYSAINPADAFERDRCAREQAELFADTGVPDLKALRKALLTLPNPATARPRPKRAGGTEPRG